MRCFAIAAVLFVSCHSEPAVTGTVDTREPIAIQFVGAPELIVHQHPYNSSPVIATYQNGESVSILSEQGEWIEVRVGDGAGWAHKEDLTTAAAKVAQDENPQAKFRIMPMAISAPSAHGDIVLEADVNTDGDVVGVRLIYNSTGSDALANENANALRSAKFYPMVVKGERKPFKYDHRVLY
jgi:uncharacterized protein YgiM (DUF1202 family)